MYKQTHYSLIQNIKKYKQTYTKYFICRKLYLNIKVMECLLINESNGATSVISLNNLSFDTVLTYKDSIGSVANSLCTVKDDYIIWGNEGKSTITVYHANNSVQQVSYFVNNEI